LTITHHELCFGCGLANLFGLQMEVEPDGDRRVAGRFFVKQDHQGPPGYGHGGVLATALDEAMALLVHGERTRALTRRLEVDLLGPAPVGAFATVRAWVEREEGRRLELQAELAGEGGEVLARARGIFVRVPSGGGETAPP
jgi:acyl-coenzyme A thioesterase PaaI-like protein